MKCTTISNHEMLHDSNFMHWTVFYSENNIQLCIVFLNYRSRHNDIVQSKITVFDDFWSFGAIQVTFREGSRQKKEFYTYGYIIDSWQRLPAGQGSERITWISSIHPSNLSFVRFVWKRGCHKVNMDILWFWSVFRFELNSFFLFCIFCN